MVTKISLDSPDYQLAQKKAYELVELYSTIPNFSFPIDVLMIIGASDKIELESYSKLALLTEHSIEEICEMFNSTDGATFYDPVKDRYVIAYNDTITSMNRIKFTIAHELGHIFLEHFLSEKYGTLYEIQEKEANYFAERLLVPMPLLTESLSATNLPVLTAQDIAYEFEVSLPVARYSINNYNKCPFIPNNEEMCAPFREQIQQKISQIQHNFTA